LCHHTPAIAYLRTSSATNVGADKDSDKRQRAAIEAFAKRAGYDLVGEYYDQAVRGADALDARPGFAAMLEHIAGNGARTIIVDGAPCASRDPIAIRGHTRVDAILQFLGAALAPAHDTHQDRFIGAERTTTVPLAGIDTTLVKTRTHHGGQDVVVSARRIAGGCLYERDRCLHEIGRCRTTFPCPSPPE
jgi:hypothetical protein